MTSWHSSPYPASADSVLRLEAFIASEFCRALRWARVAQVTVPPGPLGVVLDGEIADRPVLLDVQGVSVYVRFERLTV